MISMSTMLKIPMEWHIGVVLCCLPAEHTFPRRLFVYTATKGTVIAFPDEGGRCPVLGDWIRFRVVRWIVPKLDDMPQYCQYKIVMESCVPSEDPFNTFIFRSLKKHDTVAISVDVYTERNGNTYSSFCGPIERCPIKKGSAFIFAALYPNGMFKWSAVAQSRTLRRKTAKKVMELSEAVKKLLTLENDCGKVNSCEETHPAMHNSTKIPSSDDINTPKNVSDFVIGVVVSERRQRNGNPLLFIQAKGIGVVIGVPSTISAYPHLADWIEFKIEPLYRNGQSLPITGDRCEYEMNPDLWRIIDAPIPTYLRCNGIDKDVVIEVPLKLVNGKYFSEYVGFILDKPPSLNDKSALVRRFHFGIKGIHPRWIFSSDKSNVLKLVSKGSGHLQSIDSQAISALGKEIVQSVMSIDNIATVIKMESFLTWTSMCDVVLKLGFQE